MLTALRGLIRKDLLIFITDTRALIITLVAPIVISSFFGFLFSGVNAQKEPAKIAVALIDQDQSAISQHIVSAAQADHNLKVTLADERAARDAVRKGSLILAVIIPKGFGDAAGRAFFTGKSRPELTLYFDPSHAPELALVRGVMTEHVMQGVSKEVFGGPSANRILDETLADAATSGMEPAQKDQLRTLVQAAQALYGKNLSAPDTNANSNVEMGVPFAMAEQPVTSGGARYNSYAHAFAGLGLQFVLVASVDLGIAVLMERQRGLWRRLRSAPVSRNLLIASKVISGSLIGLTSLLISFSFAMVVFGVRIGGSVPGFLLVAAASAIMAASFGLLIAALGNTPGGTRGVSMLVVLLMLMLSGAWVPMFLFPAWLQSATKLLPVRWAIDGLDAMTWRGLDWTSAAQSVGVLLAFAAAFFLITLKRFRWEE